MFTGIIDTTGRISSAVQSAANTTLVIAAPNFGMDDVGIGDSIAVNGVCLTATKKDGAGFCVDVSPETLACTVGFTLNQEVNLETRKICTGVKSGFTTPPAPAKKLRCPFAHRLIHCLVAAPPPLPEA